MQFNVILNELKSKMSYCFDDSVCFSYPVPDEINKVRVDKFFLYRRTTGKKATRPFAVLAVSADTGAILLFEDCHIHDFVDPEAHPFLTEIDYSMPEKDSIEDFQMEQRMLRKLYEGVRKIVFVDDLSPEQIELLDKYSFLFNHAVPKALLPFYEALSPRYTQWLNKVL